MNRLKAYCRRTILGSAREYSTTSRRNKDSTRNAFIDAMHGTDSGWWNDLIYTAPMLDMAHRYRNDIAAAVRDFCSETGARLSDPCQRDSEMTYADLLAATSRSYTFEQYRENSSTGDQAEAKLFGLRFAVEWYAGDLAREYCPDL